nr:hypothetical protein [Tanacetum cinerariifolium]
MTSFGYRLNPRYAIKECSSCGTLYTRDCSCSKWSVENTILVPKPSKNYTSTNVVNAPREPIVVKQDHGVNPPHIDECCCECGEALDGIICQQCACFDQTKTPQFPVVHPPTQETSIEISHDQENQYKPEDIQELFRKLLDNLQNIHEELAEFINSSGWNRPAVYDDDDDDASPHDSELVSLEVEKIVIPEDEEIEDDNLREKLLKVNLLIVEIKALKDNLTPSSEFLTKSSSTSPKSFLEETNTLHNSLPEFETFCFDLEETSSGSTTTHSDIALPEYEAFSFYDDHIEEIRSGSTTTQSDISLPEYDSFIFYFSNDQFPPTDRSDFTHKEFDDEPAHIISPLEYDCFYFRDLPDPGELISSLNFGIRKNLSSTTSVNLPVEDDHSPLLAYVV